MLRGALSLAPYGLAVGLAACGAFAVDDAATSSSSGAVAPDSPDTGARNPPSTENEAGASARPDAEADAADAGPTTDGGCSLALGTTVTFTEAFDPKTIGWFRSDALGTDFSGLVAVSNAAPSLARCQSKQAGPSLEDGIRLVYHVLVTSFPDPTAPVRILSFGDDTASVRLTVGFGRNARVAQRDTGNWGFDFGGVGGDAVYVASFRKTAGVTGFCGAVRGPADELEGLCGAAALHPLDRADEAFTLPDSLQYLELGLPANAQRAATVSVEVRVEPLPP